MIHTHARKTAHHILALLLIACVTWAAPAVAQDANRPLRVYGNTSTIELAPVLFAAERVHKTPVTVSSGGIPDLFKPGAADIATNAETQALRQSVDHPNLRIILTVSEGFYRIVARRSAGITKLADLRGKRIATFGRTSSAYYLAKMLGTVGLADSDVTIITGMSMAKVPEAMKRGEIDAMTVWEPEIQNAQDALGADAIEFQDRAVYRELFNLNTTAENLADPQMRAQIVAFVRSLIKASAHIRREPQDVWPLVAKSTGFEPALIARVWHHEGYPGTLVTDLLNVLAEEEVWAARERSRTPRSRAELASLIDTSVLKEALEQEQAEERSATTSQRLQRLEFRVASEEAIRSIKRLQHAYAHYTEAAQPGEIARLFSRNAIRSPAGGVRSLGAEGRLNTVLFLSPVITLNPDGRSAKGRWHALAMSGEYGTSASWAGGIYENEYVLEDGAWKISKEQYFPQYAGPYETGWRNVKSESGEQPKLVPYHYTPDRAGTPIPPVVPASVQPVSAASLSSLEARLKRLNDESAVLNLQHAYGFYTDRKMWDDVADLFIANGTMELEQQGVYVGTRSIRHALEQFGPALKEGELNDQLQLDTIVTIAPDGRTARARGMQLGMTGRNNVGAQWGTSIFENTYVKEGETWKISSMHIYPRMKADYAKGWAHDAQPALGPNASYPADRPPTRRFRTYPAFFVPKIQFPNPAAAPQATRAGGHHAVTSADARAKGSTLSHTDAEFAIRLAEAERQLAMAEAFSAAENVSDAYGYYIDEFVWNDCADLFASNGRKELSYIGTYIGRERIRKSMIVRYGNGGRRGVFMAIHQKTQPFVTVAPDGRSARIRLRLFQINSQAEADGGYIAGIYENEVVLEDGVWKIDAMDLDYTWTTGYKAGWANVKEADARQFAPTAPFPYPPDAPLRGVSHAPFPKVDTLAFHFRNPVSGREPPVLLKQVSSK